MFRVFAAPCRRSISPQDEFDWSFRTVPAGYTGGGVWGNNLAVDPARNAVYAGTGDNYEIMTTASTCLLTAVGVAGQRACLDPGDEVDSVISLNLSTGMLNWARPANGFDTWSQSCVNPQPNGTPCPVPTGPDADFASAPNLFTATIGGNSVDVVGAGQKSGIYWALNRDTGAVLWSQSVGPADVHGGIKWGSAVDAGGIYVAELNGGATPFDLGPPANITGWQGGAWSALNPATGAFLWEVPVAGTSPLIPWSGPRHRADDCR